VVETHSSSDGYCRCVYIISIWSYSSPFTPHVIAWSVRKGFIQSIRRMKEQKTRSQC